MSESDIEQKNYDRLISEFEAGLDVGQDQLNGIAPNGKPFLTFLSNCGYHREGSPIDGALSRSRYHALLALGIHLMDYRKSAPPGAKMWWRRRIHFEKEGPFYYARCRVLIDGAPIPAPNQKGEMG